MTEKPYLRSADPNSLYDSCGDRFAGYPLAVEAAGSACSMVLLSRDGGEPRFFILTAHHDSGRPSYTVRPWRLPGAVRIGPGAAAEVPETLANAILHGVPLPRHGSLLGWQCGGTVTALVVVYAQYTPRTPVPSWATMPRADIPENQWPLFADESLFGAWFWEHYRAGKLVSLDGLIAATPGVTFWVDTETVLGSGSCAVARDVRSPEGLTLQRGCYVYYQALRACKPVPSLAALLSGSRIDLATRLRPSDSNEDCHQAYS